MVLDDTSAMGSPQVAIGVDGNPIVAYSAIVTGDLVVAHCNDPGCTSVTRTTLATPGVSDGGEPTLAIGSDGLPVIAHREAISDALVMDRCIDIVCSDSVRVTLDSETLNSTFAAITVGADGLPIIAYRDEINDVLDVLACGSVSCSPYVRIGR
jgi:hypothetical protein